MIYISKNSCFLIFIASLLLYSCHQKSEISKTFDCETAAFKNLEKVEDVKNVFSIDLPKDWKINLYRDDIQSSIFTADTTKQLTETVLLDVTFIQKNINFDETFLISQEQENLSKNLIKIKSKEFIFLDKPSILNRYKGRKGDFSYQICNIFIKLNEQNFILAKTEIYGDSLVNKRFCSAFSLIENIKLKK
ncbi:hypothetical protein K8354_06040 [Polaribacter litorisediminis]|uniref:hypothetical protein n=1 Tax=Polaribacter litorisediminis TaxID=1908341 RepID=UPI001CBCF0C3|nr:hypothetical protein [Polaribacter litorisediminis]UAM99371.1 hypothetical protein K8354_06040 [Polaribacter litorisediminis]